MGNLCVRGEGGFVGFGYKGNPLVNDGIADGWMCDDRLFFEGCF